jgi:SDR family mycofactocin-dependent oxidoreductase
MNMGKLDGKVAFITGAARGQGRAHAVKMAEEGAAIVAVDICDQIESVAYPMATPADLEETAKLVEAAGSRIVARRADVRDRAQLEAALADGKGEFGRLDIVVANAGVMAIMGEVSLEVPAWYDSIDVMLTGVFHTIEACVPTLIDQGDGGSIIITGSVAGERALTASRRTATPGFLAYSAAKHGVVGLMRCYARSLGEYSIRVNTVHPTAVATPMIANEPFMQWVSERPEFGTGAPHALPVQVVEAEDIANAAAFLASDDARYITGTALPVDAGYLV